MKFRKKPVIIEAIRYTGDNVMEILNFCKGTATVNYFCCVGVLTIHTLEGNMDVSIGDWVIKGVKGEFCPCKPDIFEQTYERVE